ncbi:MAG: hypothetical protein ACK5SQ_02485 [Chitinophagales bacterium]|jgi:hypothetical protein
MKDIQELVYIIQQHHLVLMNTNGQPLDRETLLYRFFEGIEKRAITSDEEAKKFLYPEGGGSGKYRRLKSDLRDLLLSSIAAFEANGNDFSDYQKAYYSCHRDWLIVKILIGQNANTAAIGQATKLLKQVQVYEFTLLTMDIAAYLAYQYGLRESNDKKFREVNELYSRCRVLNNAECLAEQLYTELMVKVVNQIAPNEAVSHLATESFEQIKAKMRQFSSYKLHLYGNMIQVLQFSSINRYEQVLPICNEAIEFFEQKPFEARVPLQMFYYQKLLCHIHLRQFEQGKAVADQCIRFTNEGNFNWFKYLELYLKLAFYTQQYKEGARVVQLVLAHPRFEFLPDNVRELWSIYESYLYLLVKVGKIPSLSTSRFKLNKFVNETRIYSRDKSGMNVAIMVIKTLYLLAERRYQQMIDEVVSVDRYCSRYLGGSNTLRSFNFMKMLMQIPLGWFELRKVEKRAARYLKALSQNPIVLGSHTHEVELIPYEDLWEMALEILRRPAA